MGHSFHSAEKSRLLSRGRASGHDQKIIRKSFPVGEEMMGLTARGCACGGFCPRCQAKSSLKISQPDDPFEREADRVADQVMQMAGGAGAIAPAAPGLQRRSPAGDLQENEPLLQARAEPLLASTQGDAATASPGVLATLNSAGQALDVDTRAFFEPRLGQDFSAVRVYTGARADQSARDMNARAYTVGSEIVFGANQYAPTTHEGKRLIAHELAHVVQQGIGAPWIMRFGLGLAGCTTPPPPEECMRPDGYSIEEGIPWRRDPLTFGMAYSPRTIHGKSLDRVELTELISPSQDHTGSFTMLDPVISEVTDELEFGSDMPDDNHTFRKDVALQTYDNFARLYDIGDGSLSFLQMYIYKMSSCGLNELVALPRSGYRITHTLETRSGGTVVAITSKRAESVKNKYRGLEYSTEKGLTPSIPSVETVLREPQ